MHPNASSSAVLAAVANPPHSHHASRALATRHRVPMNGACAVVARSNAWTKNPHDLQINLETGEREEVGGDTQPMWDYRACRSYAYFLL